VGWLVVLVAVLPLLLTHILLLIEGEGDGGGRNTWCWPNHEDLVCCCSPCGCNGHGQVVPPIFSGERTNAWPPKQSRGMAQHRPWWWADGDATTSQLINPLLRPQNIRDIATRTATATTSLFELIWWQLDQKRIERDWGENKLISLSISSNSSIISGHQTKSFRDYWSPILILAAPRCLKSFV
jgi:hypothetical protein